jgi:hypothetical protein
MILVPHLHDDTAVAQLRGLTLATVWQRLAKPPALAVVVGNQRTFPVAWEQEAPPVTAS